MEESCREGVFNLLFLDFAVQPGWTDPAARLYSR